MKAPLRWLKDYVDISLAPKELAERLTMSGIEVKGIQVIGGAWENVTVGEVIAVDSHPNADKLWLATVGLGTQQMTVICGAPNIRAGQKVPFAREGAKLIDGHTGERATLKPVKIRGVLSAGMVCSEKELGVSSVHESIMVLPDEAPVGVPLAEYLGDAILDLDITPNRPDCLSIIGIAREIAAVTGQTVHPPEIHYSETEPPIDSLISVDIDEPKLCPRYCASLIAGISIESSPSWLQQRLNSCGMRPINNIVDVTNYVMLEYGQPLHAFDYHKLRGKHIIIRRGRDAEPITTIDGAGRVLDQSTLVIADRDRAVAVAGIMGGMDTEVTGETDTVLLESANFDHAIIRQGSQRLGLQSEASVRFDKGLSPELPFEALRRATQLLLELSGGRAASGIVDAYPGKAERKPILLRTREVKRLSGLQVSATTMTRVLKSLGFLCGATDSPSQFSVVAPYWRSDISCAADLVEEVTRVVGYDEVPATRLAFSLPAQEPSPMLDFKKRLRNILVSCGFQEVLTYSLVSMEKLRKLSPHLQLSASPLKIVNPMTHEQEYLRTTLRANVLATLANNQKREENGMRVFEIGRVFLPRGKDLPREKEMLCAALSGSRSRLSWHGDKQLLDFFDAKGAVENLMSQLEREVDFEAKDNDGFVQGRAVDILVAEEKIGTMGEVHPKVAQAFDLSGSVSVVEIDLEELLGKATGVKRYQPIPRFPSVTRDIALLVDAPTTFKQVRQVIHSFALARKVVLFDVYSGQQIPEDKKSFAVRIVYQSATHTLTDEEVDKTQDQMLARLRQKLGATLRS